MAEGRLQKILMKLMENEGGKIDKWMISNLMTRIIIWTDVIFQKFIFYDIFFAKVPTGPSYVDILIGM